MARVILSKTRTYIELSTKWTYRYLCDLCGKENVFLYEMCEDCTAFRLTDNVNHARCVTLENLGEVIPMSEYETTLVGKPINLDTETNPDLRTCDILMNIIDESGGEIDAYYGNIIGIVEIPDNIEYTIKPHRYKSCEVVVENHRTWEAK